MRLRPVLFGLLLLPLAGCDSLMNQEYAATPEPPESSSVAASQAPLPEDPNAPLEAGDVAVSATGSAATDAEAANQGFDTAERIGPRGELSIGADSARTTLTVFTNHGCAYCKTFAEEHLGKLLHGFVRRGDLQIHIIGVPLQKYPNSAAEMAGVVCAAQQGNGLAMHRALFGVQTRTPQSVRQAAVDLPLDMPAFDVCIANAETAALADSHRQMAAELGVTLVPSLRIGDGAVHAGLPDYADLRGALEQALAQ